MAQSQYFDGLNQNEKSSDQQFYTNVEEHTVQYVIAQDKAQVQFPPQQILVTSGEPLMVVDGQSQQIVIEQSGIAYQGQQIQQAQVQQIQIPQQQIVQQQVVQPQQYAVVQDNAMSNGTRQIYFVGSNGNSSNEVVVDEAQNQQQPILLNHQIGPVRLRTPIHQLPVRGNTSVVTGSGVRQQLVQQRPQSRPPIRSNIKQQPPIARPSTPNQQQIRPSTPNQNQPQMRAASPAQGQIRTPNPSPNQNQLRANVPNQQPPIRQLNLNQAQHRNLNPSFQAIRQSHGNLVRATSPGQPVRSPVTIRTPIQQFRPQNPNATPVRQPNVQARQAQPRLVGQVNQPRVLGQQLPRSAGPRMTTLNQIQQLQQKAANNQAIDLNELDIKPGDEQEAVSLADGTVVSVAAYKNMLADPKSRAALQKSNTPNQNLNESVAVSAGVTNTGPKKRNTTASPRARAPSKTSVASRAAARNKVVTQFPPQEENQVQQTVNDPSKYAMVNQAQPQQQMNKTPQYTNQQQPLLQHQQQPQQRLIMQPQQQPQQQPRPSQANYVIQPPKMNQRPQQQRPLPSYIPSSQIQKIIETTPISEEFSDSIRMLVLLENGEQRLITFTLPKEACTIQEILEQVNVPFQSNTNIQVTEANSNGINYIVTVGNVPPLGYEEEESSMPEDPGPLQPPPTPPQLPLSPPPLSISQPQIELPQIQQPQISQPTVVTKESQPGLLPTPVRKESPPPEPVKDQPKYVSGMLALCGACGYLSEDFNKCMRCQRKLPENVKSITATLRSSNGQKRDMILAQQRAQQQIQQQQAQQQMQQQQSQQQTQQQPSQQQQQMPQTQVQQGSSQQSGAKTSSVTPSAKPPTPTKKRSSKSKNVEPESVHVISSDEEGDEKPAKVNTNILNKLGASVTICPISKEPSPLDIQKMIAANKIKAPLDEDCNVNTTLICRTVRIGSYRCIPAEKKVLVDSKHIVMKVPHPSIEKHMKVIKIETSAIVKVLASFNPALPVFFYYLNPSQAKVIREMLGMTADGDYYFDPLSTDEESHRRITLLPDDLAEDDRDIFQIIYGGPPSMMDELNVKEANDILIKTCPKDISKITLPGSFTEIKQLLTYPPEGRGRISINTEDYVCLATDQFLNDVIIDFYLKYLVENLPDERRNKVHVFSTFFYKRLTTKPVKASRKSQPTEMDPTLSAAQKRHARVKTWTKHVNLFEKDFVIVPINENAHWFLAIICFPGIKGCQTFDGKAYVEEPRPKPKKKVKVGTIGGVSVSAVKQEKLEKSIVCEDPELSDKDEAEGEDSEMESDDSEDANPLQNRVNSSPVSTIPISPVVTPPTPRGKREPRPPIKQPCILIFDSLAGASRSRVVATLRDYLTCEHKVKLDQEKVYDRDSIKGACPKVPQQNNFTDCGLYVLQYVEQFFNDPVMDYHIPIKQIKDWFEEIVVTRKREEIANLIKSLMKEYGKDTKLLPDITFPTLNGKVVDREFEDEEMDEEEEEDELGSFQSKEDDSEEAKDDSFPSISGGVKRGSEEMSSSNDELNSEETPARLKPSSISEPSDFVTQPSVNPKPDLREFPRQTNKDTLSILKAKRIIRHNKPVDGPEVKKLKSDQVP